MEEIWRDVKEYEGKYQVSNTGNVKSLNYNNTGKEGIMKPQDNGDGYLFVQLCKEGKVKNCRINRLVAQAFLDNPEGYTDVNHKDEDKTNNCVENLEWCDRSYNINYGTRNKKAGKRISEKLKGRKLAEEHKKKLSKPVFSVNKESGLIMWWQSIREAEKCTGINNSNIIACCKGKLKSAGGHIGFYADDGDTE